MTRLAKLSWILFINISLLQRDEQARYRLHDLQYDYIRGVFAEQSTINRGNASSALMERHQSLLAGYAAHIHTDSIVYTGNQYVAWGQGPDDGYFFDHLCYHLHEAGFEHALERLLMHFPWLQARLEISGVAALISDYENIRLPEESELGVFQSALRMAAPVIHKPAHLASQIYGHLLTRHSKEIRDFFTISCWCSLATIIESCFTSSRNPFTWKLPPIFRPNCSCDYIAGWFASNFSI